MPSGATSDVQESQFQQTTPQSSDHTAPVEVGKVPTWTPLQPQAPPATFGFTYQQPDGNRYMPGKGSLPQAEPIDIPLDGVPNWIVAGEMDGAGIWVVVLDDGRVQGFRIQGQEIEPYPIQPESLPAGQPPLLKISGGNASLLTVSNPEASDLSHPVQFDRAGHLAYINSLGDVVILDSSGQERTRITEPALQDGRLLYDEAGKLLFLHQPTDRYAHGALGDEIEAEGFLLSATNPVVQTRQRVTLNPPDVIEGLLPLWADLNGDGRREIIVTISDASQGAVFAAFDENGTLTAVGPPIGQGFRWRHAVAAAPFGPNGEFELAGVLTPHIGGVVEFYRLAGDKLEITATIPGFTSHVIRTRNLDLAASGDFDGDGKIELLLPTQDRQQLGAIRRTDQGTEIVWTLSLPGQLSTNLGLLNFNNGRLAVGAGTANGTLRIWMP